MDYRIISSVLEKIRYAISHYYYDVYNIEKLGDSNQLGKFVVDEALFTH